MSKLVGLLDGCKIYDNDPKLLQLKCDAAYYPIQDTIIGYGMESKCDYCGRTSQYAAECKGCGAPLR